MKIKDTKLISMKEKELIGLFLRVEVSDFKNNVISIKKNPDFELGDCIELSNEGYLYLAQLYNKVIDAINKYKDIVNLRIISVGNAGGLNRELMISLLKGKFSYDIVVIPHTSGKIKYLSITKEQVKL